MPSQLGFSQCTVRRPQYKIQPFGNCFGATPIRSGAEYPLQEKYQPFLMFPSLIELDIHKNAMRGSSEMSKYPHLANNNHQFNWALHRNTPLAQSAQRTSENFPALEWRRIERNSSQSVKRTAELSFSRANIFSRPFRGLCSFLSESQHSSAGLYFIRPLRTEGRPCWTRPPLPVSPPSYQAKWRPEKGMWIGSHDV